MPLLLLNKPFRVLSQFSSDGDKRTLSDFIDVSDVYPAGRLDYDSEGLLLLTDDGRLQAAIAQPRSKLAKDYWAQVEGTVEARHCAALLDGVHLKDGPAKALSVEGIPEPESLWPRNPPVRYRKTVSDSWLSLSIDEGRNRQVRRMTAAAGLPTLRLIRYGVGPWTIDGLQPGESRSMSNNEAWRQLKASRTAS